MSKWNRKLRVWAKPIVIRIQPENKPEPKSEPPKQTDFEYFLSLLSYEDKAYLL